MIKNAVLHLLNEQPLLCDIFDVPKPVDLGLLCTNLRTLDGKRPIFIDDSASAFFFPYLVIRFIEVPAAQAAEHGLDLQVPVATAVGAHEAVPVADDDTELEIDEDFLRRIREV